MSAKEKRKKGRRTHASSIQQHQRIGKSLIPPMQSFGGNLAFHSWTNDRLPEMLWACLTISVLPRDHALGAFRRIAALGMPYRGGDKKQKWSLGHSMLPGLPGAFIEHIVRVITAHPLGYAALRPLLLLNALPGRDIWAALLRTEPQDDDWQTLSRAVLLTLDHQSQEATDVRWLSVLFLIGVGKMHFVEKMAERFEEIIQYPNQGDMRTVRPSIRSMEGGLTGLLEGALPSWPKAFWDECLQRTGCIAGDVASQAPRSYDVGRAIHRVMEVQDALIAHWAGTLTTSGVDARHDTSFGFGLYALAVILEMLVGRNGHGILGRTLLRTLVESRITFAYLAFKNSAELWKKFRSFGTGQAKLALLKLDMLEGDLPEFANTEVLERLANEDYYEEFVSIDLGHWCGIDLRKMAEDSGTKDDYDRVYGWASAYVHGHWGALRDACMTHCFNPLHRMHRVPLRGHRLLEDAVPDAIPLVNHVLDSVSEMYPTFGDRLSLEAAETAAAD